MEAGGVTKLVGMGMAVMMKVVRTPGRRAQQIVFNASSVRG
jgi:hypothetical protein